MTKNNYRQKLGQMGEVVAMNYLVQKGYQIIDRNVRTPYGEIDLIALDHITMVFIEVKTRKSLKFGQPEEAITSKKFIHMINAAQAYLQEKFNQEKDWRMDVIAIRIIPDLLSPEIVHFENVLV